MKARGHVEQRGDRWVVIVEQGKDPATGKRRRYHFTVPPRDNGRPATERDAERLLAKKLLELEQGTFVAPNKVTVGEWLDRWLATTAPLKAGPKTREVYATAIERMRPLLGDALLTELSTAQIQGAWGEILTGERQDGRGQGVSKRYLLSVHGVLRAALNSAVRQKVLALNPCVGVDLPRREKSPMRALSVVQVQQLLAAAAGTRLHAPITLAALVGLRRGEVLALTWARVDLDGGTLTVAESLEQTAAGLRFKAPKSGEERTIDLLPRVVEELRRHRVECGRVQGLVCCCEDGSPWSPTGLTHMFGDLVRRVPDVPPVRFHDLRHSFATQMLKAGVPLTVVSEMLGHADPSVTARVYSHVLPGMGKEAARRLDDLYRQAAGE